MAPDDLERLARYNAEHADNGFWDTLMAACRRHLFAPLTDAEIERALDEAEWVPLSEERIQEMVCYATGHPTTP